MTIDTILYYLQMAKNLSLDKQNSLKYDGYINKHLLQRNSGRAQM